MEGMVADCKRFAVHDGPGIRTTMFLKGCPLRCKWCHNPENLSPMATLAWTERLCTGCGACAAACPAGAHRLANGRHDIDRDVCTGCGACLQACLPGALKLYGQWMPAAAAAERLLEDRDFYGQTEGGVTLSGGEPLMQPAFCRQVLQAVKAQGVHTGVDTCGDVPWPAFEQVLPVTDLFLYDLKQMDTDIHRAWTGRGNEQILDNLRRLDALDHPVELRIPIIPGCNDDADSAVRFGRFIGELGCVTAVRLLAYHGLEAVKYQEIGMECPMPETAKPTHAAMEKVGAVLRDYHPCVLLPGE